MVSIIHQVEERPQSQANPCSSSGFIQSFLPSGSLYVSFVRSFPTQICPICCMFTSIYFKKWQFEGKAIWLQHWSLGAGVDPWHAGLTFAKSSRRAGPRPGRNVPLVIWWKICQGGTLLCWYVVARVSGVGANTLLPWNVVLANTPCPPSSTPHWGSLNRMRNE